MNRNRLASFAATLVVSLSLLAVPAGSSAAAAAVSSHPHGVETVSTGKAQVWLARHHINPHLSPAPSLLAGAARTLFEDGASRSLTGSVTKSSPLDASFTDAYYESLVVSATPDLAPGQLVATTILPQGLPVGSTYSMSLCTPNCATGLMSNTYYPNADGNFDISVAAGTYEEMTTIWSAQGLPVATDDQTGVVISSATATPISLTFADPSATVSGTLALSGANGHPLSVLDTSAGGADGIAIAACPVGQESACTGDPLEPQAYGGYAIVPTFTGNGNYSFSMNLPAGSYGMYAYYFDESNGSSPPTVSGMSQITVTSGQASNFSTALTVAGVAGTVAISGVPAGSQTLQPVLLACDATVVTLNNCQSSDASLSVPVSEIVVLQQGASDFVLPNTGAKRVAPGWVYDGSLYIDSGATTSLGTPLVSAAFVAPNLTGTVANGTSSEFVAACPTSVWLAQACSAISTPTAGNIDDSGHYGIYTSPGAYSALAVSANPVGHEGAVSAFTSPSVNTTVPRTGGATANLTGITPSSTIAGNLMTPDSDTQILKLVVACTGPVQTSVSYATGCPQGVSQVTPAQSSFGFQAWPGVWTIYVFDQNSMLTPAFTKTMTVVPGVNRADVTLSDPAGGVYGKVVEPNLNLALFGQTANVLACPAAVAFQVGCAGGVETSFNFSKPLNFLTDFYQGNGTYNLRLAAGMWKVAPLLVEGGGTTVQPAPATVTVASGGAVRQDFTTPDYVTNLSGNAFEVPNGTANMYFNVIACPASKPLVAGCAGGAAELTYGHYAVHLAPGAYRVQAISYDATGQVIAGNVTKVSIADKPSYADLFDTPPALNLHGVASIAGAPYGSGQSMVVRACPVAVAFGANCTGGISTGNSKLLGGDNTWSITANPGGDAFGWSSLTGAMSPYNQSFPYSLALGASTWRVALGWVGADGQLKFGSTSMVTGRASSASLNLAASYQA